MILIKIDFLTFMEIKQASPFKKMHALLEFFLPLTIRRRFILEFEGVWIEYNLTFDFSQVEKIFLWYCFSMIYV